MTAARIREAAKVLRKRSTAATSGPWGWDSWTDGSSCVTTGPYNLARLEGAHVEPPVLHAGIVFEGDLTPAEDAEWTTDRAASAKTDATYIATVDPTFGLAVAAWLESTVERHEPVAHPQVETLCCLTCDLDLDNPDDGPSCDDFAAALAVADAILGGGE